jgi:hypothetical protein
LPTQNGWSAISASSTSASRPPARHTLRIASFRSSLASALAQLAFALDEHGSPIDYARRRALFTDLRSVTFDLDAYARLRLQHGWSAGYAPRGAVLRWYLLVLLTGEHPAIAGTKKPFSWRCNNFRYGAPRPLRVFLRQQAEASLTRHGITEPVTWEPPPHWVTRADWPGTDPDRTLGIR